MRCLYTGLPTPLWALVYRILSDLCSIRGVKHHANLLLRQANTPVAPAVNPQAAIPANGAIFFAARPAWLMASEIGSTQHLLLSGPYHWDAGSTTSRARGSVHTNRGASFCRGASFKHLACLQPSLLASAWCASRSLAAARFFAHTDPAVR